MLNNNRLIYKHQWVSFFYTEEEILNTLEQYEIEDEELVFEDWKVAKMEFKQRKFSIPYIVRSISMAMVPTICILLLFLFQETRKNPIFLSSVILYILYLIPYILISHQLRYQRPLFLLQIIFVYLIIIFIIEKLMYKKA